MRGVCRSSCRGTQHRLVINCGLPTVNKENWRQVARATAAHSTVTFNDVSSCRFLESRRLRRLLFGAPIIARAAQRARNARRLSRRHEFDRLA